MNFLLPGFLVSKDSFSFLGQPEARLGSEGAWMGVIVAAGGPLPLLHPTPVPPLPRSQVPRMGRVADGLGWMGWPPICPLPPIVPRVKGDGRGLWSTAVWILPLHLLGGS